MADIDKVRVRTCAAENCTIRLSSIEKDEHVLCPTHSGWQCSFDTRCDICRNWSEVKMKEYLKLQAGKARRKVYKDKKRAEKRARTTPTRYHLRRLALHRIFLVRRFHLLFLVLVNLLINLLVII